MKNGKPDVELQNRFLQTCRQLLEFFRSQATRAQETHHESSGAQVTERSLECGLDLRAESPDQKTLILQIFFVQRRFEEWKKRLGPIDLFYANPFGIEVIYRKGAWAFFVEEERLLTPASEERVEVARFQINQEGAHRVPLVPLTLDCPVPLAQLEPGEPRRVRDTAASPGIPVGEQQVSRLLEALG